MSLILHLSDLHLGSPSDSQFDYSDRFGLDRGAGDTKIDHLRRTLHALGDTLRAQDRVLDAVVVSGDLTNANQRDGYDQFGPLLGELGDRKPEAKHIVVVPGNHDADWTVQPGKPAKFRRFLDTVRSVHPSPLISGLDYDKTTLARSTGSRKKSVPIVEFGDVSIVAVSSADFCGVEEQKTKTPWDEVIASFRSADTSAAGKAARAQAGRELLQLRVQDMARVDKRQIDALSDRMSRTSLAAPADDDVRLRIAVLHHPIGPVTDREEIKAFENLTNLEQVRSFLFDKGFHVVLHGHKHASYAAWEWLLPSGDDLDASPRRALVIGAPGDFRPEQIVCRLLEAAPNGDEPVAGAPRLRVIDVLGVRPGETLKLTFSGRCLSLAQPFVRSTDTATPWVVRARNADAAYQQLRDLPTDPNVPRAVISVVDDASSADRLPCNYPEAQADAWLINLVKWWQLPQPQATGAFLGSDFNHGERLYGRANAIRKAAMALPSSKAVAVLIDVDEAGDPTREFPALTAVQLQARGTRDGGTLLDAVGIYRKQDLRLWWPVNIAELAFIQRVAVKAANENDDLSEPVEPGRLIAISTFGLFDTVLPQMAGTVIDRAVDLRPEWPHRLAYLAAHPQPATQREWSEALADIGNRLGDDVFVPSIGLARLKEALEMQKELGDAGSGFTKLLKAVERLTTDAEEAVRRLSSGPSNYSRAYWASQLRKDADQIMKSLRPLVSKAGVPWR